VAAQAEEVTPQAQQVRAVMQPTEAVVGVAVVVRAQERLVMVGTAATAL
jgi:hypothetical protein